MSFIKIVGIKYAIIIDKINKKDFNFIKKLSIFLNMKYFLFKQVYRKLWRDVDKKDKAIAKSQTLPDGIIKETHTFEVFPHKFRKSKKISFNIYYDKEKKIRPTLLEVHGGGWAYGNKELNNTFCHYMAKLGFNVISFNYTLAFKAKLINQLFDINKMIEHLYLNKDKYLLDMDHLYLNGDSAGGELTFLYSAILTSNRLKDIYDLNDDTIKYYPIHGICLNHATPYIKDLGYIKNNERFTKIGLYSMKRMLLGKNFLNSKIYNYSEPNEIFDLLKEEGTLSNYPKTIILTSIGDHSYYYQSERLIKDFKKYNLNYVSYISDDDSHIHVFNVRHPDLEKSKEFNKLQRDFFLKK